MKKTLGQKINTTTTIIAVIAIAWYLLKAFSLLTAWWALPALAAITGVLAIALPFLGERITLFIAPVSTGIALLFISVLMQFSPFSEFVTLTAIIFVVAILTEISVNSEFLHAGNLIIDLVISVLAALLIKEIGGTLATPILLIIAYVAIIAIDFDYRFSIKEIIKKPFFAKKKTATKQTVADNQSK